MLPQHNVISLLFVCFAIYTKKEICAKKENIKANETCKITKNTFEKSVRSMKYTFPVLLVIF